MTQLQRWIGLFLTAAVPVTLFAESGRIALPTPEPGDLSVREALKTRRSVRRYSDAPLTLSHVSTLLWSAQGITGQRGKRTAPSAGALYPLETYLVAGTVDSMEPGIYRYIPAEHELEPVKTGDRRGRLAAAALGQSWVRNAPASIVFTAVFGRTTGKYGRRGRRYVYMEAGHAGQNIYLQAESLGLGCVAVAAFEDSAVQGVLGIDDEAPLYIFPVGRKTVDE